MPPSRERLPNGDIATGSSSSPASEELVAVDVGGAGPSNDKRSNNIPAPPAECFTATQYRNILSGLLAKSIKLEGILKDEIGLISHLRYVLTSQL